MLLLTMIFLDVEKFTTLTPCELSFPIVCLKIFSLPTLALPSPNKIFISYFAILSNMHSISS
jgi:hypothetical protein